MLGTRELNSEAWFGLCCNLKQLQKCFNLTSSSICTDAFTTIWLLASCPKRMDIVVPNKVGFHSFLNMRHKKNQLCRPTWS